MKLQQLAPDNLNPELKALLSDDVGDVAKLAIVVLLEQKMGHVTLLFCGLLHFWFLFMVLVYLKMWKDFVAEIEVFVYAGF